MALTIYRPVPERFFQTEPNSVTVKDLRVTFDVEKHTDSDPNTCEVSVYNLSATTRAELERKPLRVLLEVGYDGQLERLFIGDLRWSQSRPAETEWETKMELGDGERAYRHARVSRSFRGGVTARDAAKEIAASMDLTLNQTTQDALARIPYVTGLTVSGPAYRELSRVLSPHGLSWSIQDGQLQVLSDSQVRAGDVFLISQDSGLIGSPEWGAPNKEKKPPRLSVRCLCRPAISPGSLIEVQSRSVNGRFRVEKIKHTGDTHGEEWTSEMEASPR